MLFSNSVLFQFRAEVAWRPVRLYVDYLVYNAQRKRASERRNACASVQPIADITSTCFDCGHEKSLKLADFGAT